MSASPHSPGLFNFGPGHWQTIWESQHPDYRRVQLDWTAPRCADWMIAAVDAALSAAGSPFIPAAYNLACATVAHWARSYSGNRPISAAFLVAATDVEAPTFPTGSTGFQPMPMQRLPSRSVVVSCVDDPYVALHRAKPSPPPGAVSSSTSDALATSTPTQDTVPVRPAIGSKTSAANPRRTVDLGDGHSRANPGGTAHALVRAGFRFWGGQGFSAAVQCRLAGIFGAGGWDFRLPPGPVLCLPLDNLPGLCQPNYPPGCLGV